MAFVKKVYGLLVVCSFFSYLCGRNQQSIMKKSIALGLLAACSLQLAAQVRLTNKGAGNAFPLVNGKEKAVVALLVNWVDFDKF